MRLLEVIQRGAAYLAERNIDSPRLQAELLLAHVLRTPRLQLYLEFERSLSPAELEAAREAVRRRGQHIPLQHILGTTSFCGLELETTPNALIPRPETELLAERAWTWLRNLPPPPAGPAEPAVLDWGTGTGCLAIAIAHFAPAARITALDRSPDAIALARRNADRRSVAARLQFLQSDGCRALPPDQRFHLVVANPPYIPSADLQTLQPEVRDHDPRLALDGGPDGLDIHRRLATELATRLEPGGVLLIEFADGQAAALEELLEAAGWIVEERHRDYSGRDRFLLARRAA